MSYLYVADHGVTLGIDGGNLTLKDSKGEINTIPKDTIDGISMFGKSSLTPKCIQFCLDNGIIVGFYSQDGNYHGCLSSINNKGIVRVKKQILSFDDNLFSVELSKKIISAKINNQYIVIKRYLRESGLDPKEHLFQMRNAKRRIISANNKNDIKGYEGIASKNYFEMISNIIDEDFAFDRRSRRPARDPFNCMLNFGYSILNKEIYGYIEDRGLNPYCGFLHEDRENHAALVSDLIEEWRAPIVDSTVLSLIQGHEIDATCFTYTETGTCLMTNEGIKLFLAKLEAKMHTEMNYLSYISKPVSFRKALWHQVEKLSKAVDNNNPMIYEPILLR